MAGRLEEKVTLITGGGSGIGRAAAMVFAREGSKVVVADVDTIGGEETVKMVQETGREAVFVRANVANEKEVENMVVKAVETFGHLDCAFNNAGIISDDWDDVLNINLKGVWLCINYEIRQMLKQGGGAIVNTSSIAGLVGRVGVNSYIASKHGVVGLTRASALQYAKNNIRINAVCPNFIHTPFIAHVEANKLELEAIITNTPMGRIGDPMEVAEAVVWLCSNAASYVTGIALPVDGGYTAR